MSRRERKRRRQSKHPAAKVVLIVVGVCVLGGAIAVGAFAAYVAHIANSVPSIDAMKVRLPGSPSVVYADNGRVRLGYMASDVVRIPLTQQQQPQRLREATVAIEDRNFWHHGAVDYEGLVRAAIDDVIHHGNGEQGGSTLTMQLVKNTYPYLQNISSTRSLKYKIAQAKLATQLYQHHSRAWILTQYLNDVEYTYVAPRNAIGVGAAARMLFSKPVSQLDLAQTALLAGLPQAPTGYNPFVHPKLAKWRRGLVLQAMARAHDITWAQAKAAQAQPLDVHAGDIFSHVSQPYVFNYVQGQLVKKLDGMGLNGRTIVDSGGLKIYTTINLADQEYAKDAIDENEGYAGDPAASLVSIDPYNGHILAMQNSTKYGTGKGETTFNYAAQAQRQTGSVFKAFVLMTLIHDEDGNPNETYYNSAPLAAGWLPGYPTYSVANASESDAQGVISVTKATTLSINAVYAQLGVDVGMKNVDNMAHAMGITSKLFGYPAEAIGGLRIGVSALQIADAYSTIANYGNHIAPTIISKVVLPDGKVINLGNPKKTRVFSQGQAYAATQVLKTVVQDGTGYPYTGYGCPAAGKTGTTSNYTDAWFAGYNPKLTTAVWVGYPNATTSMTDVNGLGPGYGGPIAGPIWKDYMEKASDGYCGDFPQPDSYWSGKPFVGAHSRSAPASRTTTGTTPGKATAGTDTNTTATGTTTHSGTTSTPNTGTTKSTTTKNTTNKNGGTQNSGNNDVGGAPPPTDPSPP